MGEMLKLEASIESMKPWAHALQLMIGDVLNQKLTPQCQREVASCPHQFHALKDIQALPNSRDEDPLLVPWRCATRLGGRDHLIHRVVSHGSAMALQHVADQSKHARGIEDAVLQLLFYELRIPHIPKICSVGFVDAHLILERDRVYWNTT